ncbi:fam-g protein [Plasmodium gallinaceum]|uniref:Fam-g protein n=1 Tax=Plasmodium gallinaceum TaxID=5849 RepID=A0A1J1GWW5_PLAGA|nr:fam-g protein [Plasmodium gallinaceum]CRG95511.1 fam-g protein [Plasmodium gallinaceum]
MFMLFSVFLPLSPIDLLTGYSCDSYKTLIYKNILQKKNKLKYERGLTEGDIAAKNQAYAEGYPEECPLDNKKNNCEDPFQYENPCDHWHNVIAPKMLELFNKVTSGMDPNLKEKKWNNEWNKISANHVKDLSSISHRQDISEEEKKKLIDSVMEKRLSEFLKFLDACEEMMRDHKTRSECKKEMRDNKIKSKCKKEMRDNKTKSESMKEIRENKTESKGKKVMRDNKTEFESKKEMIDNKRESESMNEMIDNKTESESKKGMIDNKTECESKNKMTDNKTESESKNEIIDNKTESQSKNEIIDNKTESESKNEMTDYKTCPHSFLL